jgi:hypothetical protein
MAAVYRIKKAREESAGSAIARIARIALYGLTACASLQDSLDIDRTS